MVEVDRKNHCSFRASALECRIKQLLDEAMPQTIIFLPTSQLKKIKYIYKMNQNSQISTNNPSTKVETQTEGPVHVNDELNHINERATNAKEMGKDPNVISSNKGNNLMRDTLLMEEDAACPVPIIAQRYSRPAPDLLPAQDYFRKPVLISTILWTTSVTTQTINPYSLWENLAVVNSKFGYYNRRSYNLKLSFSLVGSPYHIGVCVVDWNPSGRGVATTLAKFVGYQRRHVTLTPQLSFSELEIPHWSNTPYRVGSAPVSTSYGTLSFAFYAPLSRADAAAPGTITIQVRAWTEDMVQSEPSFTQTSGVIRGAIDFGKTAVSLAGKFVSSADWVASMLGFSIHSTYESSTMVTQTASNLTCADGNRPTNSLNVFSNNVIMPYNDCKGYTDELLFRSFTSRPGLLQVYTVTSVQAINTVIANIPIHPMLCIGAKTMLTPTGSAALSFSHWTGSLVFGVEVISSPLQQGSILIAHEPSSAVVPITGNIGQAASTARSCIMDISETTYMRFIVSAAGGTNEILDCCPPRITYSSTTTNPMVELTDTPVAGKHAGYLSISINKPIISPGASQIHLLVSMFAGPDFQLLDYNGENIQQFSATSLAVTEQNNDVMKGQTFCDLRMHVYSDIRKQHAGEAIISFRPLLQRYAPVLTGTPFLKADTVLTPVAAGVQQTYSQTTFFSVSNKGNLGLGVTGRTAPLMDVPDLMGFVGAHFARATGGQRVLVMNSYRASSFSPQLALVSPTDIIQQDQSLNNATIAIPASPAVVATNAATDWAAPVNFAARKQWLASGAVLQDLRQNPTLSAEYTHVGQSPFMPDASGFVFYALWRDCYNLDQYMDVLRAAKPDINYYEFVGCPLMQYTQFPALTGMNIDENNPYP